MSPPIKLGVSSLVSARETQEPEKGCSSDGAHGERVATQE